MWCRLAKVILIIALLKIGVGVSTIYTSPFDPVWISVIKSVYPRSLDIAEEDPIDTCLVFISITWFNKAQLKGIINYFDVLIIALIIIDQIRP